MRASGSKTKNKQQQKHPKGQLWKAVCCSEKLDLPLPASGRFQQSLSEVM